MNKQERKQYAKEMIKRIDFAGYSITIAAINLSIYVRERQ